MASLKDMTAAEAIKLRGGGQSQADQIQTWNELPNEVVGFVLSFQNLELSIIATEDDTVELTQGTVGTDPDHSLHVSDEVPWSQAIGKPLRWGWLMTNQQGYQDAVQFEFARSVAEPATIIQLVAIGSSLKVLSVIESHQDVHEKVLAMGS